MLFVHDIGGKVSNETKLSCEIKISSTIDYPKMKYGFQHFYHQTVTKTEKFKDFDGKKRVYNIINFLEPTIDDYSQSLSDLLKITNKRGIYKMIECISLFGLLNDKKNTTLNIGSNGYQYAEGIDMYCKKYYPNSTSSHSIFDGQKSDDPSIKTIKYISNKYSLITINQSIKDKKIIYDNILEQSLFPYIFDKIHKCINHLENGGNLVVKMYDTFTESTMKLLLLTKTLFDKMYIYKPLSGKFSNPEKIIVFKNFQGNNKNITDCMEKIVSTLESLNSGEYIVDYCEELKLPNEFIIGMIKANCDIANQQFKITNKMLVFIEKQNYRGEEYNNNKARQIAITKKWMELFYPEKLNNTDIIESVAKFNEKDIKFLNEKITL